MRAIKAPRINLVGRTPLEEAIPLKTPFVLFIDPASNCNFQCTFCPTGDRELIRRTGRFQGTLKFDLYKKLIDDLSEFPEPIKVLRLYKDGEPFLNRHLAEMISYAKSSDRVPYVDTTTNGSLLSPEKVGPVLEAGIDRINISIDGMNREQYKEFTKFNMDFEKLVSNISWLYENRGKCEIVVKIPSELISHAQEIEFYETFGDISDRIFVENFAPCWPVFDVEERTGVKISKGIYQQEVGNTDTCPYIFYAMSVNSDGLVSSCFLDWERKLIVGDARVDSLRKIWSSDEFNALRIQHLEGRRKENPVCAGCGQLSHCLPDSIDGHREQILVKFRSSLERN